MIRCGRSLELFAYLAHTLRDLSRDLRTGDDGLLYLAKDDMARFHVTESLLFADLARRHASDPVRALVADIVSRARTFLRDGRKLIEPVDGQLEPDCGLVLESIVSIYERILEKVESNGMDPFAGRHIPTDSEKRLIIQEVARRRGMEPCI